LAISTTAYTVSLTGDGVTTSFPFSFPILDEDSVNILVDGVTQTLDSDYTVTSSSPNGDGTYNYSDGGTVVFEDTSIPTGTVTITRCTPRTNDVSTTNPISDSTMLAAIDQLTMAVQEAGAQGEQGEKGDTGATGATGSLTAFSDIDCDNSTITGIKTISFYQEVDNGNSSTAKTIDLSAGMKQKITLTGNCTVTWSNPDIGHYLLKVIQDATGSRTLTLPSGKWSGGSAYTPTSDASAVDILSIYYDGSAYWYSVVGLDFSVPT
jgi:hypothetical protein